MTGPGDAGPADAGGRPREPLLRVVRGDATEEELTALVVALLGRPKAAAGDGPARPPAGFAPGFRPHDAWGPPPGVWQQAT